MNEVRAKLTVFFEAPFWVGVFQRTEQGRLYVSKVTFGPEPTDPMVWEFLLRNWSKLRFSPGVGTKPPREAANPKRAQRLAQKQTQEVGVGTRSQQALRLQREQQKAERQAESREQRQAEQDRLYQLKKEKRKQKHRGR